MRPREAFSHVHLRAAKGAPHGSVSGILIPMELLPSEARTASDMAVQYHGSEHVAVVTR